MAVSYRSMKIAFLLCYFVAADGCRFGVQSSKKPVSASHSFAARPAKTTQPTSSAAAYFKKQYSGSGSVQPAKSVEPKLIPSPN